MIRCTPDVHIGCSRVWSMGLFSPCFPDMDYLDYIIILLAKLEDHNKTQGNSNMGNVQRKVKGSAECPVGSLIK